MKKQGESFENVLGRQLKSKDFKLLFDERRFYLQVAHLVSELRARSGLSQADVADLAGVSQPLIARLERGDQQRAPTFDTLFKILKALGYSLEISVRPDKKRAA